MVRYAVERGCFNITGAVDPAPDKAGAGLGRLCDIEPLGVTVRANFAEAVKGDPPVKSRIAGGINGDTATCAITLNTIPSILKTTPGLKTMANIPLPAFFMAF